MKRISIINNQSEAKQTYADYFENDNRTIFLNGKWGSGKSTYLNEVFENTNKKVEVSYIDLWHKPNESNPVQIIYRTLYPLSFYFIKCIAIILSLSVLIFTFLFNKLQTIEVEHVSISLIILGFTISLISYMEKVDWENFFTFLLEHRIKFNKNKKIIVIDDFDRIDLTSQEVIYKIFHKIKSKKIQFAFVGHYMNIAQSENTYLQKIIDNRIELPFTMYSANIWKKYYNSLIKEISKNRLFKVTGAELSGIDILFAFAVKENRVIRELIQFNELVDLLLIKNKKVDKINIDQQLIIIYLYHFHFQYYELLVSKIDSIVKEKNYQSFSFVLDEPTKEIKPSEFINDILKIENEEVLYLIHLLLSDNNYPFDSFIANFPNYLLNYYPNSLGSNHFMNLLYEGSFNSITSMSDEDIEQFYYFINKNQNVFSEKIQNILYQLALHILEHRININYFFYYDDSKVNYLDRIASRGIKVKFEDFSAQDSILKDVFLNAKNELNHLDISQRMRICYSYFHIGLNIFREEYEYMIKDKIIQGELSNFVHPSIILTSIISLQDSNIGVSKEVFSVKINSLSEKEFLYYLYYNSQNSSGNFNLFTVSVKNKHIFTILENKLKSVDQSKLSENFRFKLNYLGL